MKVHGEKNATKLATVTLRPQLIVAQTSGYVTVRTAGAETPVTRILTNVWMAVPAARRTPCVVMLTDRLYANVTQVLPKQILGFVQVGLLLCFSFFWAAKMTELGLELTLKVWWLWCVYVRFQIHPYIMEWTVIYTWFKCYHLQAHLWDKDSRVKLVGVGGNYVPRRFLAFWRHIWSAILDDVTSGRLFWMTSYPVGHFGCRHIRSAIFGWPHIRSAMLYDIISGPPCWMTQHLVGHLGWWHSAWHFT